MLSGDETNPSGFCENDAGWFSQFFGLTLAQGIESYKFATSEFCAHALHQDLSVGLSRVGVSILPTCDRHGFILPFMIDSSKGSCSCLIVPCLASLVACPVCHERVLHARFALRNTCLLDSHV